MSSSKAIHRNYSRKLFTKEEDELLIALVKKYDENWKKISNEMNERSIRQCKERYFHYLSPDIKKDEWTFNEDLFLMANVEKFGKKWKKLELLFSGRTEIDIRNRFNVLQRRICKTIRKDTSFSYNLISANAEQKMFQANTYNDLCDKQDKIKDKEKNEEVPESDQNYNAFEYSDGFDYSEFEMDFFTNDFCF